MTPDENFAFINAYLERMGPVIRDHNGFIDKYIGDAIMALFESADDALRAGLAMLETLEAFNAERRAAGQAADRHRHRHQHRHPDDGHDRREAPHGRHGHLRRRQPRLAHREPDQDLSRRPAGLAVHRESLADPKAYDIRPIDVVVVKGKTHPVTICEVFQRDPAEQRAAKAATRDLLQSGVEALARRDLVCARRFFEESLQKLPGDMAASNLLQKCG